MDTALCGRSAGLLSVERGWSDYIGGAVGNRHTDVPGAASMVLCADGSDSLHCPDQKTSAQDTKEGVTEILVAKLPLRCDRALPIPNRIETAFPGAGCLGDGR